MEHLDPDRLVLLALADGPAELGESVHLADCAGCRQDLETLRHVAVLGSEGEELRDLPAPPERVWRAIESEVHHRSVPVSPVRRRRWLAPVLSAAAAAVIAVAGTVSVTWFVQREPQEQVVARATLAALPKVPAAAHGTAQVLADGTLRVDARNLPLTTGFHEVWLIDPDDPAKMQSIGNLGTSPDATLPLPEGIDLRQYRLVDISDEAHDGDAAHSGHSLLRGTLTS